MAGTPNTIGLILLFAVVFLVCILWATGGHTENAHPEEENHPPAGKTS